MNGIGMDTSYADRMFQVSTACTAAAITRATDNRSRLLQAYRPTIRIWVDGSD